MPNSQQPIINNNQQLNNQQNQQSQPPQSEQQLLVKFETEFKNALQSSKSYARLKQELLKM